MENALPEAPSAMNQMDWFLGRWDVVSRSKDQEGDWIEEHLVSDHSLIIGGHAILEHFRGPLMGKPFEAWSLRKYNPSERRWEQRWVDTTPGGFADWTGHWNEDTRQFVGNPNRVLAPDGTLIAEAVREVFFAIEDDRFSWKYETTEDGGGAWTLSWSLKLVSPNLAAQRQRGRKPGFGASVGDADSPNLQPRGPGKSPRSLTSPGGITEALL